MAELIIKVNDQDTAIEMQDCKSSNVKAIGYNQTAQTLYVSFGNGVYEYAGVSFEKYNDFMNAESLDNDLDTISTILTGEAAGEGVTGMIAVACVMLNREHNYGHFGMKMVDQAVAHMQFQGQTIPAARAAIDIVHDALDGKLTDITKGALYYANPRTSSATWARRLNSENSLKIGNQYFTDNVVGIKFPR
ncbi:unnamed protein product [Sphagnum balticum]